MEQQSNQLGQYTVPTTPKEQAFYSRHSGAINRYTIAVIGIQLAWSFFSYNPAVALITDNTSMLPQIQPFIPTIAAMILMVLHYVLKAETLETFSNVLDKDETTINGAWNYIIPVLICGGLFLLDKNGVSSTLRDTSFEGKKTAVSAESQKLLDKATADYKTAIAAINATKKDDEAAAIVPFSSQLQQARAIRTYDGQDIAAKNRKISAINNSRDNALTEVRKSASDAAKSALSTYNAEKSRINGKLDSAHTSIDTKDRENAAKSGDAGWYVSAFFLLLFLLMNYKLVYLRVNSGIRINKEFTQLDAEGSFLEKLQRVITSIAQRQGHRFLVFFHKTGSTGTATLSTFDGRVILQQSSYNGSHVETRHALSLPNGDINNDGTSQAPPPLPPAPPKNGNGGSDDDGGNGGDRTTPAAPVPTNAIQQPQTATASAVAVKTAKWSDIPSNIQYKIACQTADTLDMPTKTVLKAHENVNPLFTFSNTGYEMSDADLAILEKELIALMVTPTPSVETPKKAVTTVTTPIPTVVTNNTPPQEITPKTVVTVKKTVTTENNEFSYGDSLLRSQKQEFQKELSNLKNGNGKEETIMKRLQAKSNEFDSIIRNRDIKATLRLKAEISEWVLDNVSPVISNYLSNYLNTNKEGTND